MMTNASFNQCTTVIESWKVSLFSVQILSTLTLSIIALLSNLSQLCIIPKVKLWPANVRLFLCSMGLAAFLVGIYGLFRFIAHDHYYISFSTLIHTPWTALSFCRVQESLFALSAIPLIFSMPGLAVERLLATKHLIDPSDSKPHIFVMIIVASSWLLGLLTNLALFLKSAPSSSMCFCQYKVMSHGGFLSGIAIVFFFQWVIVNIIFLHVLQLNKKLLAKFNLGASTHSLEKRFKMKSTVQLTQSLLPSVLTQAVISLVTVLLSQLVTHNMEMDMTSLFHTFSVGIASAVSASFLLVFIQAALHPFILYLRSDVLRNKFLEVYLRKEKNPGKWAVNVLQQNAGMDRNVEILGDIWDKYAKEKDKRR